MNKPLTAQRFELAYKAVHLQCLDKDGATIAGADASGFIRREGGELFLYTCWHVVTGYDMRDLKVAPTSPVRMALAVTLQNVQVQYGAEIGAGPQRLHVPLYDSSGRPLWFQERKDDAQAALHGINLRVPFSHDAIKLRLPVDAGVSNIQAIEEACFLNANTVMSGDKVLLVGYPHGFSALGLEQVLPIVLTRFVAATQIPGTKRELLLDGSGVHGMSGSPVFIERDASIFLLGLYTGSILPDQASEKNGMALGVCCDMTVCWKRMPLQPYPVLA